MAQFVENRLMCVFKYIALNQIKNNKTKPNVEDHAYKNALKHAPKYNMHKIYSAYATNSMFT